MGAWTSHLFPGSSQVLCLLQRRTCRGTLLYQLFLMPVSNAPMTATTTDLLLHKREDPKGQTTVGHTPS